jgi:hypothetical protein
MSDDGFMGLLGLGIGLGIAAAVTKPFIEGAVEAEKKAGKKKFDPDNPFGL